MPSDAILYRRYPRRAIGARPHSVYIWIGPIQYGPFRHELIQENVVSIRIKRNYRREAKKPWQVRYYWNDRRVSKQFATEEQREIFIVRLGGEILDGDHIPDGQSKKIKDAGELYLKSADVQRLRSSSRSQLETHLRLHIYPFIGHQLLSKFDVAEARRFHDNLSRTRSSAMVSKVMTTLGTMLADAMERRLCKVNAVREMKRIRRRSEDRRDELQVGVEIPTNHEITKIIQAADDEWRPMILTMILTGMRSSEFRALYWSDIDLKAEVVHVRRMHERCGTFNKPKSKAGTRTIPMPPMLVNTLKAHQLKSAPGTELVFHKDGQPIVHSQFVELGLLPTLCRAGIIKLKLQSDGKPLRRKNGTLVYEGRRYTGTHAYRHWYCTWLINRKVDGGQELDIKRVQKQMGHSSIAVTLNIYSHLLPQADQKESLAEAQRKLFGI